MLTQCAVDFHPTFPVNLRYFLFLLAQEDCWGARSLIFWNEHGKSGNVFCKSTCVHSAREHSIHGRTQLWKVFLRRQVQDTRSWNQGLRQRPKYSSEITTKFVCQKFIQPYGGGNFKNYGADQKRLQISEVHFDKFPTPQTFSCWEMRFQTEMQFRVKVFLCTPSGWRTSQQKVNKNGDKSAVAFV